MRTVAFTGFTELIDFLRGLRANNNRAWCEAHRADSEKVCTQLNSQGLEIGGQTHKRVPPCLPANHPRAEWLRHSGLFAATERPLPGDLFSSELAGVCVTQFQRVAPLQQWLVDLLVE